MDIVVDARGGYKEFWPLGRRLLPVQFYRFEGGTLFSRSLNLARILGEIKGVLVEEDNKFLAIEDLQKLGFEDPEDLIIFNPEKFEGEYVFINSRIIAFDERSVLKLKNTLEGSEKLAVFYKPSLPKPGVLHCNPSTGESVIPQNVSEASKLLQSNFYAFSGIYKGNFGMDMKDSKRAFVEGLETFESLVDVKFLQSSGNVELRKARNLSIFSERELIVSGVEDLIILDMEDLTFIASMDGIQGLKEFYEKVKLEGDEKHEVHRTAYRPWGSYTVLEEKEGFKVKRITVKPGKRLSLQLHYHRSEHWTVVRGTAKVTVGEKTILMRPGDHVFIPAGEVHRLENPGRILLEVIEVQVGEYLGEDDIVRIEDDFKRV